MKRFIFVFTLLISLFTFSHSQIQLDLLDPGVRDVLMNGLDGELAKEHVIQISKFHRVQGSQGYRDAANYVLAKLRSYGFSEKDAYIETFKSDGNVRYQTWQSPSGWSIASAELSMTEPEQVKIISYPEIPMGLMTYSNPGDLTAEVVWVGAGTSDEDYAGKNIKGKFVLATGSGDDVHRLAVIKYGAKAIVSYMDDTRGKENRDMVRYTGIWPRTEELKKVTFGFNISNKEGEKIKSLLDRGTKVVLHGVVKGAGLTPGFMDVVVANIRSKVKPDQQLLLSAHLDHPAECANDNASGSAAILDIARTLKYLIDSNKISQPGRSIRFVWVPEWYGTMAYIDAHPDLAGPAEGGNFLANINLDMVGENLEMLHSKMYIVRTPRSVPSCLNEIIANMASMVDKTDIRTKNGSRSQFNYRVVGYRGGSDHMMFLDRKIPSVMITHSDYTHHTTYDTPDKVDPVELERSELIAVSTMWYLANLNREQGLDLMELLKENAYQRFGEMARVTRSYINASTIKTLPTRWGEAESMLNHTFMDEIEIAKSVLHFNGDQEIVNLVDQIQGHYAKRFEHIFAFIRSNVEQKGYSSAYPEPLNDQPDERIPTRLTRGPLDFRLPESKLPPGQSSWYNTKNFPLDEDQRFELVNFIDGSRKMWEIRNLYIAEYPSIPDSVVSRYFDDLAKIGVLKWKSE